MSLIAQSTDINIGPAEGATLAVLVAVYAVIVIVMIVAYVKIISKAGYSGWWVLIGLVPIANVVFFLIFAFSDWPILQENRRLRSGAGGPPQPHAAVAVSPAEGSLWGGSDAPGTTSGPPPPPPPPST